MLLRSLEIKDLTDCEAGVLEEHLSYAIRYKDSCAEEIFEKYILCPRVEYEMLAPYRAFIDGYFSPEQKAGFVRSPREVWRWIQANVSAAAEYVNNNNRQALAASPVGTLKYRIGGEQSRKLLFVAVCRTLGIPARICPNDGNVEFFASGRFHRATVAAGAGLVALKVREKNGRPIIYGDNFTFAVLKGGVYETLRYPRKTRYFEVEPGYYRLITGRRLTTGAMSVNIKQIDLFESADITVEIPTEAAPAYKVAPLGDYDFGGVKLKGLLSGRVLIAYVIPSHEPSEHLLNELMDAMVDYRNKEVRLIVVTTKEDDLIQRIKSLYLDDLTVIIVNDDGFALHLAHKTGLSETDLPFAVMTDTDGNAAYYTHGYHVGSAIMALNYI